MVPRALATRVPHVDVVAAMDERPRNRAVTLKVVTTRDAADTIEADPYAGIEV
jgi:hypothetical protein